MYAEKHIISVQLWSKIALTALLYGLEACPLVKSDLSSLDFVINRFFMKLFRTNNITVSQKKQGTIILSITKPNVDLFSNFFHWQIH